MRAYPCVPVCARVCVCVCGGGVGLGGRATLRAATACTKAFRFNLGRVALRVSMSRGSSANRSSTLVAPNSLPVSVCSRFASAAMPKPWAQAARSSGASTCARDGVWKGTSNGGGGAEGVIKPEIVGLHLCLCARARARLELVKK